MQLNIKKNKKLVEALEEKAKQYCKGVTFISGSLFVLGCKLYALLSIQTK